MKKLIALTLISISSVANADEYRLNCYVSHPVKDAQGDWTRENVAQDEKVLNFSSDGSTQNIYLNFSIGSDAVRVEGSGSLYLFEEKDASGKVLYGTKSGSVVMRVKIPSKNISIVDTDGLLIDLNNIGITQGGVGSSSTTLILDSDPSAAYSFGCSINRTL